MGQEVDGAALLPWPSWEAYQRHRSGHHCFTPPFHSINSSAGCFVNTSSRLSFALSRPCWPRFIVVLLATLNVSGPLYIHCYCFIASQPRLSFCLRTADDNPLIS